MNDEERRHAYVFRGRTMGKTSSQIETLKANREAKILVADDAQRKYLIERGVLPGQIVTMGDLLT
jgi:hypothetical protein